MPISACDWCLTLFLLFTETSLLQTHSWMTFSLPTLFSCPPVICVKPSWDNILTNGNNLSQRSISCDQHQRLFHLCSIFISKSNVQALTPNPPTVPSAAGWRRMGGRLWRGKGRSCSWCHNGWSCATTSCATTSVSNTSWRWETRRRVPPKIRTLNARSEEWKSMSPVRLCAVTCWMTFMSTRPWKRTWGSCRDFTCCIADSEWLRSVVNTSRLMRGWFQR